MFDYEIVMSSLTKISKAIETIIERTSAVDNLEDQLAAFTKWNDGN